MPEHRILVAGDLHNADQDPSSRKEGYRDDILRKVEEIVDIALREEATHLLLLGDVFDRKHPAQVSHFLVGRLLGILRRLPIPVLILVGNHDISSGSLTTLPKQPVSLLAELPNVQLLTTDPLYLDSDVCLYPVPGIPIKDQENWLDWYKAEGEAKRKIIVAHQLIVPDVQKEIVQAREAFQDASLIAKATEASLCLYGDYHGKQNLYKKENSNGDPVFFANYGSICRISISDVNHVPEVALWTIKDDVKRSVGHPKVIPLTSVRPAEEVYLIEERTAQKLHQADIDETIKRLNSTQISKFSLEAVIDEVNKNSTVEPPVRAITIDLLEVVR